MQSRLLIIIAILLSSGCGQEDKKELYYEQKFKRNLSKLALLLQMRVSVFFDEGSKGEIVNLVDQIIKQEDLTGFEDVETYDLNKVKYRYKVVKSLKIVIFAVGCDGIWNSNDDLSYEIDISKEAPEAYVLKKGKSIYFDPSDFK
jgi:hypothetical protein